MTDTVKIGCRMPHGVTLRVAEWVKDAGGQPHLKETAQHTLSGSGQHVPGVGGLQAEDDAVYTEVPAKDWETWFAANKDSDLVRSGAVFKGKASAKTAEQERAEAEKAEARAAEERAKTQRAEQADAAKAEAAKAETAQPKPAPKKAS